MCNFIEAVLFSWILSAIMNSFSTMNNEASGDSVLVNTPVDNRTTSNGVSVFSPSTRAYTYTPEVLKNIRVMTHVRPADSVLNICSELNIILQHTEEHRNMARLKKGTRRKKRGGRRKQRPIEVVCTTNLRASKPVTHINHDDCVSKKRHSHRTWPSNRNVNKNNLIHIDCRNAFREHAPQLRLGVINTQSCRNKIETMHDIIEEMNIDIYMHN